jgi:hypothetical protein
MKRACTAGTRNPPAHPAEPRGVRGGTRTHVRSVVMWHKPTWGRGLAQHGHGERLDPASREPEGRPQGSRRPVRPDTPRHPAPRNGVTPARRSPGGSRGHPEAERAREGLRSPRAGDRPARGGQRHGHVAGSGPRRGGAALTTDATAPRESGHTRPGPRVQRPVGTRHQRRSRAARRGDVPTGRTRPRLRRHAWAAKRRAVRRVTPDTRGHKPAGLDGVKSLPATPRRR